MYLIFDCETTIAPPLDWTEGQSLLKDGSPSPYNPNNKLVSIHYKEVLNKQTQTIFCNEDNKNSFQSVLDSTELLIAFNIKFDLSWIRECGFVYTGKIWDVQLVEYLKAGGNLRTPSLNQVAESYGFDLKKDKVKEYWQKGIDTDKIPQSVLKEYGEYDVELTEKIYLEQIK